MPTAMSTDSGKSRSESAIVVIDMQNDFVSGSLGTPEARTIVPAVEAALERNKDKEIWFTLDTHGPDYQNTQEGRLLPVPHCMKGTWGHEIVDPLVRFTRKERLIEKPSFGSKVLAQTFAERQDIHSVTLMGVCTDICVISNALLLKAFCPEMEVIVAADLCAGTTALRHEEALHVMTSCQIQIQNLPH